MYGIEIYTQYEVRIYMIFSDEYSHLTAYSLQLCFLVVTDEDVVLFRAGIYAVFTPDFLSWATGISFISD